MVPLVLVFFFIIDSSQLQYISIKVKCFDSQQCIFLPHTLPCKSTEARLIILFKRATNCSQPSDIYLEIKLICCTLLAMQLLIVLFCGKQCSPALSLSQVRQLCGCRSSHASAHNVTRPSGTSKQTSKWWGWLSTEKAKGEYRPTTIAVITQDIFQTIVTWSMSWRN